MEKHIKGYSFLRGFLGFGFKLVYQIKITGKENIPVSGPVVVCGNHNHVHDQFPVILSTKRMIHYMAKKEYFDGKMAWFFRMAGCIPVDRSIKDESAKAEAISILEENEVFGIFPEGTRNELSCKEELIDKYYKIYDKEYTRKEFKKIIKKNRVRISQVNLLEELYNDKKIDYNFYKKYVINAKEGLKHLVDDNIITLEEYNDSLLLPLKFGAVSMAKKTDSVIVPFASNGEYKLFGKRPKVKIGEGFKVSDMSLEDANNKLRKEIISLLVDILD